LILAVVPPQNPVDRTIVDVTTLGVKLAYPMLHLVYALLATARSSLKPRRELALRNLALRQQLAILQRGTNAPS
jgi:serine phosphatase RsbU (regulator of sigma subunit)